MGFVTGQSVKSAVATTSTTTSAFPSATTSGNLIVVLTMSKTAAGVNTVSDSKGNTYTSIVADTSAVGGRGTLCIHYAANIIGGASHTITASSAAGGGFINVAAQEFTGVSATPFDHVSTKATGTSASPLSGSATATGANEVVIGFTVYNGTGAATLGSGYTNLNNSTDATGNSRSIAMESQVAATSGSKTAGFSITSTQWDCYCVTFTAAATSGIAVDASTPAVVTSTSTSTPITLTTASFSPPAGSLVLALASNGFGLTGTTNNDITISDSGSHTWTTAIKQIVLPSGTSGVSAIFYTYFAAAPGSITVSTTYTNVGAAAYMQVQVLTGAASTQLSGVASTSPTASTTSGEISVTTTTVGSMVFGLSHDAQNSTTFVPLSGTTQIGSTFSFSGACTIASWHETSATTTPGATTYGGTWGVGTQYGETVALEVLPAGSGSTVLPVIMLQALQRAAFY
jgi:hypothetical protein